MSGSRSRTVFMTCAVLFGAVLLGGALACRLLFESPSSDTSRHSELAADTNAGEIAPIAPTLPDAPAIAETSNASVEASAGAREEVVAVGDPLCLPFGKVRLEATFVGRTPVASVYTATFIRDGRSGSMAYSQPTETPLSVGRWRGALTADGYESIELPEFDIVEGETTDLGLFVFEPGTASIRGSLRGLDSSLSSAESAWIVDLFGGEVPTCEACPFSDDGEAQPCDRCGRIGDRWRRHVALGADFAFTELLSGRYRIHVQLPDVNAVGVETWVDLARGKAEFVTISIPATRSLEVDLFDEHGAPFVGIFEIDGKRRRADVHFRFERGELPDVTASCTPPLPDDARSGAGRPWELLIGRVMRVQLATEFEFSTHLERAAFAEPPHLDRPHDDPGSTIPRRTASASGDLVVLAEHREGDPPNRFRVVGLPPEIMELTVRCSEFESKPVAVDLRLQMYSPIRVVVVEGAAPPELEAELLLGPGDTVDDESELQVIGDGSVLLDLRAILEAAERNRGEGGSDDGR